jgi:hypothetical protein
VAVAVRAHACVFRCRQRLRDTVTPGGRRGGGAAGQARLTKQEPGKASSLRVACGCYVGLCDGIHTSSQLEHVACWAWACVVCGVYATAVPRLWYRLRMCVMCVGRVRVQYSVCVCWAYACRSVQLQVQAQTGRVEVGPEARTPEARERRRCVYVCDVIAQGSAQAAVVCVCVECVCRAWPCAAWLGLATCEPASHTNTMPGRQMYGQPADKKA